jgi:hypothetical protein
MNYSANRRGVSFDHVSGFVSWNLFIRWTNLFLLIFTSAWCDILWVWGSNSGDYEDYFLLRCEVSEKIFPSIIRFEEQDQKSISNKQQIDSYLRENTSNLINYSLLECDIVQCRRLLPKYRSPFHPENGDNMFLRNVGELLPDCTA